MTTPRPPVLTVSQLTARIKDTLESAFPSGWVSGEVSDFSQSHAGHIYFTLKDEQAQIRGVIWRTTVGRLRFKLQDGLAVLCCGDVDVYPPRGSYQLVVRQIEPRGEGALQLAFRQLHAKLAAEGLFDPRHKKPLPRFPRRIAIVTSPTGAAVRDFLEVVRRRWPDVHVLIIPARVQGEGAAQEIARGVAVANHLRPRPDVLVVTRGGGSIEDLWSFNEEVVVRAIFASAIPVVSAVGHEIDVTLADLVADVREPTPSAAAERIVPSADEVIAGLRHLGQRLSGALRATASDARTRLDAIARRRVFSRPFDLVQTLSQQVDDLDDRLSRAARQRLTRGRDQLATMSARLESLSPLAVLSRGYSVTTTVADGSVVRDAATLAAGDLISSQFASGRVVSRVE